MQANCFPFLTNIINFAMQNQTKQNKAWKAGADNNQHSFPFVLGEELSIQGCHNFLKQNVPLKETVRTEDKNSVEPGIQKKP